MSDTVTRIRWDDREIILLGTAHVSSDSVREVRDLIAQENPDQVCVELDEGRLRSLTEAQSWEKLDIFQVLKQKKGFLLLANLAMASFQRKIGQSLDVKPGMEMQAAVEEARTRGIPATMVDREISVTLRRAWALSGFWNKNKLLAALLGSALSEEKVEAKEIEALKNRSELENMMDELSRELPSVKKVLIDERDQYLATKIFQAPGKKVLAVLGAGHVPGIIQWLEDLKTGAKNPDLSGIDQVPPPGLMSKIGPWIIPGLLIVLIALGFLTMDATKGLSMIKDWALATGIPAGIGTILALGHPLTILAAVIAAPITTAHPALGVGMVTGLVQAFFRRPRVVDFETLNHDITSLKGFYHNRITHVLLVMLLSSLGASVGTFLGLPSLISRLIGG